MEMSRNEIKEKLVEVMLMAMGDTDAIQACTEKSELTADLALNSVGILYTVIAIEEFFGISFDNANFADFKTVGDVIDYIEAATK